jgi:hypothetical protein
LDLFWVAVSVLGVSFVSNVSPFFGASYTLLATLQLTLIGFTPFNFLVVVVVSAVGATLAKVVIYYGAFGFKDFLERNRNVRLIGRNSTREGFYLVLFVAALLPVLPLDDFIYIGAGASAASLGTMASVTLAAKTAKSGLEVAAEATVFRGIAQEFGFNNAEATVVLSLLFLALGIAIYKLDWEGIYRRFLGERRLFGWRLGH